MNEKEIIEDLNELLIAIEQSARKEVGQVITLQEHGFIPETIATKLIKSKKFILALAIKAQEELAKGKK